MVLNQRSSIKGPQCFLVDSGDIFESAFCKVRGRDITGERGGPFRGELGNQNLLQKRLPVIPPTEARRDASIVGTVAIGSSSDTDGVGSGEYE
jgi:hypothetical protein